MTAPTVAIVDDHRLVWSGLSAALAARGFVVVAEVTAVTELPSTAPDVVVCDLHLPTPPSGAAAVEELVGRGSAVLAISGVGRRELVMSAIEAGASGFLEKAGPAVDVAEAAWAVHTHGVHISPRLATLLLEDARLLPITDAPDLTPAHRRVLRGVEQGDSPAEIASSMMLDEARVIAEMAGALELGRVRRRRVRLTDGELDVIGLVACGGFAAREIAAALHISTWTVQSRLESVRRKYCRLNPQLDPERAPREVARLWAADLELCRDDHPNRL